MADNGLFYVPGEYESPWEGYNGVVNPIGIDNAVDEDWSMYDHSSVETECAAAKYKVGQPKMKPITSKYAKKNISWTGGTFNISKSVLNGNKDPKGPDGPIGVEVLSKEIDCEILKEIKKQEKWLTKKPGSDQQV